MTVRQVFYQATVRGPVEKAESGYGKIQTDLTVMRRAGELPYDWLADNTRWQRKPRTFKSIEDALKETARFYRKALWDDLGVYAEIWLEKDALAGVLYPVTSNMFDVPLMVARGYASLSFLHSAAEAINSGLSSLPSIASKKRKPGIVHLLKRRSMTFGENRPNRGSSSPMVS